MTIVGFAAPLLSVISAVLIRKSYRRSVEEADAWQD
jgi:hypothetical protein